MSNLSLEALYCKNNFNLTVLCKTFEKYISQSEKLKQCSWLLTCYWKPTKEKINLISYSIFDLPLLWEGLKNGPPTRPPYKNQLGECYFHGIWQVVVFKVISI